ncbi:hypothetical protein KM043_006537 [Ampulex compressa]|nr:hypothetical protein KM043_006537 [Ampulex compressa]
MPLRGKKRRLLATLRRRAVNNTRAARRTKSADTVRSALVFEVPSRSWDHSNVTYSCMTTDLYGRFGEARGTLRGITKATRGRAARKEGEGVQGYERKREGERESKGAGERAVASSGGIQIHVDAAQSGVHHFSSHSPPPMPPACHPSDRPAATSRRFSEYFFLDGGASAGAIDLGG